MKHQLTLFSLFLLFPYGSWSQEVFTEVSGQAGINHVFEVESATFGGGATVFDMDNDGWEDLYLTGGNAPDALYRNNGDGTFTNVFEGAGFDHTGEIYTQGVSAADVDRNGYKDLLITTMNYPGSIQNLGPNLFYLNNGDGTFTEATEAYGLASYTIFSTGASFGDINADGYPDLYISNYFYLPSTSRINVLNEAIINGSFQPAPDYLFLNAGGKYFVEVSGLYGMEHDGYGFQGVFTDYDNDQDLDLYIANDFGTRRTPNVFLQNEYPRKEFKNRSLNLAMNYGFNAMGIAPGDVNMDGWMDYFVTNISTSLYVENQGNGQPFQDKTFVSGLALPTIRDSLFTGAPVSWGANFFDYDHDLDLDLFICNGSLNPTLRLNPNLFFVNDGTGNFERKERDLNLYDVRIGRGSVTFDYDRDGDLDLLVVNQAPRDPTNQLPPARVLLYRNDIAAGNWLQIELEGLLADRNGIGSRVEVVVDGHRLIREIDGGSSHISQNSTIAHFGLANYAVVDSVIIKWIGGNTQHLTDVPVNQRMKITETTRENTSTVNQINVFPTIFRDYLIILYELAGEDAKLEAIELFSADGKRVASVSDIENLTGSGAYYWEALPSLTAGVYLLVIETENGTTTQQVVKH